MGLYHHVVLPGRAAYQQQQPSSAYRGRSSPSPHANRHQPAAAAAHLRPSQFAASGSNFCGVIIDGGGSAFTVPSQRLQQQRKYLSPHSSHQSVGPAHQRVVVAHAAPQDRHATQFRPIVPVTRSAVQSPTSSKSPSSQTNKRAPVSPKGNGKYKMELCKNYPDCAFGEKCIFAHGPEEINRPDPGEMVRDGRLLYVCEIFASTGACPFNGRCDYLHDPNVKGPEKFPAWMQCKAKQDKPKPGNIKPAKNDPFIPDPNYHYRMKGTLRENPVIDPNFWDKCRPNREFNHGDEFRDTMDMVCNNNVTVFPPTQSAPGNKQITQVRPTAHHVAPSSVSYSSIVRNVNPTSQEATNLAIVLKMVHNTVFTYTPTHYLNGQPCMILQTRYFQVGEGFGVVQEVSVVEYSQASNNDIIVRADEVVFDSKGKRSCNDSIWFDSQFTPFPGNKKKREHSSNDKCVWSNKCERSLFCMPNNNEFEQKLPDTPPFMIMHPHGDDGFNLTKRILQNRIDELVGIKESVLAVQLSAIKDDYARLAGDLKRWKLPRTKNLAHLVSGDQKTPYTPSDPKCHAAKLYVSFAAYLINSDNDEEDSNNDNDRLSVFHHISSKADDHSVVLPSIKGGAEEAFLPSTTTITTTQSLATETWQDLLLGIGGMWTRVMEEKMRNDEEPTSDPPPPSA